MNIINTLTSRKYYKSAFLFVVFLNTLGIGYFDMDITFLYIMLILWGVCIIGVETLKGKLWYRGNHLLYIGGFFICLSLATFANHPYSSQTSFLMLTLQLLVFLLLFTQKKGTSLMTVKNEMRSIQKMTCFLTFTASLISVLMFFLNVSTTRNGVTLGLVGDRLFGVYFNCNPAAFLACMSLIFSLVALRNRYSMPRFYMANIVVQLLYILLTGTRSVMLILLMLLVSLVYYTLFKRKKYGIIQQVLIIAVISLLFFVASFLIRNLLYLIPQMQGAILENSGRLQLDKLLRVIALMKENPWANRKEIYDLLNILSSSRLELWYDAYRIWRTSPLFGIGVDNFKIMGQTLIQSSLFDGVTVVHAHNFLMEALMTSGVFGFVCFFAFLFRSVTALLETLRKYTHTKSYLLILMIGFIIFIEAAGGFLDYGVFYVYSMSSVLLWIYLGYLYWLNDHPRMKLINDSMMYDFINYHLGEINYQRSPEEEVCDVQLKIENGKYFKERDMYIIRMKIYMIFHEEKHMWFAYDGLFHIRKANMEEEIVEEYKEEMALELYEIVMEDIASFISDASDTILLPPADRSLLSQGDI